MIDTIHIDEFSDRLETAMSRFRAHWKAHSSEDAFEYPEEMEMEDWLVEFSKYMRGEEE